jgi:ABC-type Fe3+-siderophore transport system permease subunit
MAEPEVFQVPSTREGLVVGEARAGERWRFSARGHWRDWFVRCGPDGFRSFAFHALDLWPRLWNAPYFCLVGQIEGRPETMFRIGAGVEHEFQTGGPVVVFANDHRLGYWNNNRDDRIELTVTRLPSDAPEPAPDAPEPLRGWALARYILDGTQGVFLVPLLAIAVSAALLLLPQGRDLVRVVTEDPIGGQQVAFAATLLFLCVQAWFWPRIIINYNFGSDRTKWPARRYLEWTPRILPFIPFLITFAAFLANASRRWDVGLLLIGVAALLFAVILIGRDDRPDHAPEIPPDKPPRKVGGMWARAGLILSGVTMLWAMVDPVAGPRVLGPPAVVFLGVGLMMTPLALLIQAGARNRFPAVALLIAAAVVFGLWMDNHTVGRRAFAREEYAAPRQIDLATAYSDWKARNPALADGSRPMVLVAAEGGASRAGFWTGEVLAALHEETGGVLANRLFAISSVSGGSVGAVGYVAALKEHRGDAGALRDRLAGFTGADALSPTMAGLLFTDLLQRFIPVEVPWLPDRAEGLERSWENAWANGCAENGPCGPDLMRRPFLELWSDGEPGWTPLVIVNGASEETGRRILTSRVAFTRGQINADDFHLSTGTDVATSTAIHNGARFPYISPAGTLRRDGYPRGHIIDGGYFDPAGTEVVRELAHAIAAGPGREDVEAGRLTFIFVYIGYRGMTEESQVYGEADTPSATPATTHRLGNELLAPAIGMLQSRTGHAAHLMRSLKADVARDGLEHRPFVPAIGPQAGAALPGSYIPVLLCDAPTSRPHKPGFVMPMDWALSAYAQDLMREAVRHCGSNAERLAAIRALMGATSAPR